MVLFVANKDGKNISFHLWDGQSHIAVPFDSDLASCQACKSFIFVSKGRATWTIVTANTSVGNTSLRSGKSWLKDLTILTAIVAQIY